MPPGEFDAKIKKPGKEAKNHAKDGKNPAKDGKKAAKDGKKAAKDGKAAAGMLSSRGCFHEQVDGYEDV